MTAEVNVEEFSSGFLAIEITGVASAANAGQGSILNPYGEDVHILRGYLVPSVVSAGAANLSIGVTTAAAAATDLLNAAAMAAVSVVLPLNCIAHDPGAKTVVAGPAIWSDDAYLTFTASASLVGFVGVLYLEILRKI